MVDAEIVAGAVALMAATGAVAGVSERAAMGVVERVRSRVRTVFGGDARSAEVLAEAIEEPSDEGRVRALAEALALYARRDEAFAQELAGWAVEYAPQGSGSVTQSVVAGRDAYTAGRDMTVNSRTNVER